MPDLVFKSPPPDVELLESVDRLLRDWGTKSPDLQFVSNGVVHQSPGVVVFQWTHAADPNLIITVTLDDVRRARYLHVAAADPDSAALLTTGLGRRFSTYSVEELRDAVRREGANDPAAFVRLAMVLDREDEASSRLIQEGLESPDTEVRANAATAVMHLRWPGFRDAVLRARLRETDAGFANLLEALSRGYAADAPG
ncbi:hypothetical protein [Pyxidicoccus sp. MSG2]|uniref:hypothetical protein n=1 Tax=Pyxidicoccus sp. MSG2 TaxID=2996790 RepID=UPI00227100E3|nr:hypothetical protein [Pyxidicoccus sp. MSG2]MCY1020215.1 hypothetical protein [Pyxidicoccus sp. MSG2]